MKNREKLDNNKQIEFFVLQRTHSVIWQERKKN